MTDTNKQWIVYKIANLSNGKLYIGITCRTLQVRWRAHIQNAVSGRANVTLAAAIRKYGADNFRATTVTDSIDFIEAAAIERGLIAQWGTMVPNGYNMTAGGEARWGRKISLEVRSKMSVSAKLRVRSRDSAQVRANKSAARKAAMTPALRAAIGDFHRGRKRSADSRARMSAAKKGKKLGPRRRIANLAQGELF